MTAALTRAGRRALAALLSIAAGTGIVLGTVAAPAGLVPAAMAATGYCTGAGVNVVVDFTDQGGGIARGCAVHGAGGDAWDAFGAAGFPLTPVQSYPGAVCRVSGRPADASCQGMPPADAYWGFFTSHGSGWSYASVGPTSYTVEDGDTVAFAWQSTSARQQPRTAPAAPRRSSAAAPAAHSTPAPTPAGEPTRQPAAHPGDQPSDPLRPHPAASTTAVPASATPPPGTARATRDRHARPAAAVQRRGAACAGAGVDVVVDFHQLGGGVLLGCAHHARTAWQAFTAAGVRLTELQRFAGAVCRVDGKPVKASCVGMPPGDAYWSLYVTKKDRWAYATKGAKALVVHDGDVVALSWQGSKQPAPPSIAPGRLTAAAAASSAPAPRASSTPSTPAEAPAPSGGIPWWVPVVVLVLLGGAGGALALRRRTTGG
ncbi:MAG: hypothetical protein ACTHNS_09940 [Marmoricola sp.]